MRHRLRGERGVAPTLWRQAFEDLGPTYIKLGQIVASSYGLFPAPYVQEFQKCLDRVRPFAFVDVEAILRSELGRPPGEVFASFDEQPLASASVAQVHLARLADGQEVAVKIQRPRIEARVDADMAILRLGADFLGRMPRVELVNPEGIVADFDRTIHEELDFLREAANMDEFNRIMVAVGRRGVAAPRVVSELTTRRVLVMERFRGFRVDDVAEIQRRGFDAEGKLIEGMQAWFQCLLRYGFFHGDVHAGNLMLLDDGRIGFLDFGIIGRLSERERRQVTEYIYAFASADYARLAQVMRAMGSVGGAVDMPQFERDLRQVYTPMLSMSFGQLKYGELIPGLMRVAFKHQMRLPSAFVLVTKQMLYFDRYAKIAAPGLNIFTDPRLVAGLGQEVMRALMPAAAPADRRPASPSP